MKMKKISGVFLTIVLILCCSIALAAPKYRGSSEALYPPGTEVIQVFSGYSTTGVGIPINPDFQPDHGSWQIVVNGSPSAYEISIEGSLVGAVGPYVAMSTMTEANLTLRHYSFKPVPFTQAIINSKTGAGSFDLYFIKRGN